MAGLGRDRLRSLDRIRSGRNRGGQSRGGASLDTAPARPVRTGRFRPLTPTLSPRGRGRPGPSAPCRPPSRLREAPGEGGRRRGGATWMPGTRLLLSGLDGLDRVQGVGTGGFPARSPGGTRISARPSNRPRCRPPRCHPGLVPGSREAGRGRCLWPWTPEQVRGDTRGRRGCRPSTRNPRTTEPDSSGMRPGMTTKGGTDVRPPSGHPDKPQSKGGHQARIAAPVSAIAAISSSP